MYQERDRSRPRQPTSLESLYMTVQNACSSLQNTLDGICKQCDCLQIESRNEHAMEVLESLDTFESEVQLAMLSDAQCQLLVEDLDLNLNESTVMDIVKKLRDLELLRKNVSTFFKKLNKRFYSILDDGVYLYCVSLFEITHEEIREVIEYDEFISNQKLEISQAVEEIHHLEERWGNLTLDLNSTIDNLDGLQACLTDVQARWKEIQEKIFEWLKQDRNYPNRITGRISSNKDSIQCLLLEMDMIDESQKQSAEVCRLRQEQIKSLQKRRRELYNNLGHVQRAKRYNASKMSENETKSAQEINRDNKPDSKKGSGGSKSQNEFHRRRDARLDKEQSDVKASIASVDKKIDELKKFTEEEKTKEDASLKRIKEIHTAIAVMEKANVDCRTILSQRGKAETFIKLRKGTLAKPTKGDVSFEEACRYVAYRLRHEWPRLYLHLPMWPIRNYAQRLEDINGLLGYERMNVVLPRNRTPIEDAAAALAKWRLLSRRYINLEGLVTGLRQAGWLKLANEARKRFVEVVPQEEQDLKENREQEIVTENNAVLVEELEASKGGNDQLTEVSTCEEAGKELEEVSFTESKEGKVDDEVEVEKGDCEDTGSQESEDVSADLKEDTKAKENDETECDKSEFIHDNCTNQESVIDGEGNRDDSCHESNRANSVNGDLLEEMGLEEEAEKKHDFVEEIQEAEPVEVNGKSKSIDKNNSVESEQEESTSIKSTRKSSVSSIGPKEEDKPKQKEIENEISNSLANNTSECEISKDGNVVNEDDEHESTRENELETSGTVKEEDCASEKSSKESVLLDIPRKSQENASNDLVKNEDGSDIQAEKKEQSPRRDSIYKINNSVSKEKDDSVNTPQSPESKRPDMITGPTSAGHKKVAPKNLPNKSKNVDETKSEEGVKQKLTKNDEKSCNIGKKVGTKMPESKIDKKKPTSKGAILKTAGNNSKNKSTESAKKVEKPKSNHTSKSKPETKIEEPDVVIKKQDSKVENSQERDVEKEMANENTPKQAESKLSPRDQEAGSDERENASEINDDDRGREGEEPYNKEEDPKSKENVKGAEKPPSKAKSSEKEEDKKAAKKLKADKSGKRKADKKK